MSNPFAKIKQVLTHAFNANAASAAKKGVPTPDELTSTTLKRRGDDCRIAGNREEAKECYRQALALNPGYAEAHNTLGSILLTEGSLDEALLCFEKALEFKPDFAKAHYNQGAALQAQGRLAAATRKYRDALELMPDFVEARHNLGTVLIAQSQAEAAVDCFQKVLALKPDYAAAFYELGTAFQALGRPAEACKNYRKSLALIPNDVEALFYLGNVQQASGQLDQAAASYRRALEIKADFIEAQINLGNVLREVGRLDEAVASYRRALEIRADFAEAHSNLGNALRDLGRLDEAVASYRRAVEIRGDFADAHNNLGTALQNLGQLDEAVASYRRALQIRPDNSETLKNLGDALLAARRFDEAVASYRRALEFNSDFAEAYNNLGTALRDLGRHDEAVASYRRALEVRPEFAEAHSNLGAALHEFWQLEEAVASYRQALELRPEFAEAHSNLGAALQELGRLDEAAASYRQALEFKPEYAEAYSNLLFCLSQDEAMDASDVFAEYCRFAEKYETPLRANWPQHANLRDPERILRIGFVSADLRSHPVASFIEPLLPHLAQHPKYSLHAYHNHPVEDAVTKRIRGSVAHWHPIFGLSDDALAQSIIADGIDILIDLSGHTARHRLLSFARKPAPVQATWIGYPATTGLKAMDYYLCDRFFLPPGQFDNQFTEKLVHLPAITPFLPNPDAPPVRPLPALNEGFVTFGSFNRICKLNRPVIALWAQLLRALPDARMLLGAMSQAGENEMLIEWFGREGIARERLSFHARCSMQAYLDLHHQVDLCLDTFPYNGGTTTNHAFWMGVPTLTLAGGTAPSRVGASVLSHMGMEAFLAHDKKEFFDKGLYWAAHLAELAEVREGLRVRFSQSAFSQPAVIAAALERALRIMWQRWCAGLPAESFEVFPSGRESKLQEADV